MFYEKKVIYEKWFNFLIFVEVKKFLSFGWDNKVEPQVKDPLQYKTMFYETKSALSY